MKTKAEIGILGGTGLYNLIKSPKKIQMETPYGQSSAIISIGKIAGRDIAFIPRHGEKHQYPPHKIPFQANLWSFKKLGVKMVIAPCAVGSLKNKIRPGTFVICDQFFNWTRKRKDTYYDGPEVHHISSADPYCKKLRKSAIKVCKEQKINYLGRGTVVVIEGPRFSTRQESRFFENQGFDLINMTQYPEVILARELGMCYLNISLVTDYDAGIEGDEKYRPVDISQVIGIINKNNKRVTSVIFGIIKSLPQKYSCLCEKYIKEAKI